MLLLMSLNYCPVQFYFDMLAELTPPPPSLYDR